MSNLEKASFLYEMNKFCKKKHCFALRSECLYLKYVFKYKKFY